MTKEIPRPEDVIKPIEETAKPKEKRRHIENPGNSIFSKKRYRCQHCQLYFLTEEVDLGRFNPEKGLCARCLVYEKRDEIEIPPCFGKSYNGSNELCTKICGVQTGCMIHFADGRITDWELPFREEEEQLFYSEKRTFLSYKHDFIRLMRLIGKPMHVTDVAPLLNKFSGGRYNFLQPYNRARLQTIAKQSHQLVALQDCFFVWRGVWDPEVHQGLPIKHRSARKPLPLTHLALLDKNKHLRKFLSDEDKLRFFGKIPEEDEIESLPIIADAEEIKGEVFEEVLPEPQEVEDPQEVDHELESILNRREFDKELADILDGKLLE